MNTFDHLKFPSSLRKTLTSIGFSTPTSIQAQAIPPTLEGKDLIATAQTGTGKTGAFCIPLAAKLIEDPNKSVLVLTPTRELATQVQKFFSQLLANQKPLKTALIIGGDPIFKQLKQLKANPQVIVGTPGRLNDHLKRGSLNLSKTAFLVLDETDLMLDMGFDVQIETLIQKMPKNRQTLMFSATLPKRIEKLSAQYLVNPIRVSVGEQSEPGKNITQESLRLTNEEKYPQLIEQLGTREGSVIIFVKTKRGADKLSLKLNKDDHRAEAIHGDLRQSKRERILKAFRSKKYRIMVATDVAARGIDIPHIRHVINFDLPQCPEDYIHRIGRTARAGQTGSALSFVTGQDKAKWRSIERLLDPNARDEEQSHGRKPFKKKRKPSFRAKKTGTKADFRPKSRKFSKKKAKPGQPSKKGAAARV